MEDFSLGYLDRRPVEEASKEEMYEFDLAVGYAGEILLVNFDMWKGSLEDFVQVQLLVSAGFVVWTSVSFLVMIFSIDKHIGGTIYRDYRFFRKIYNNFMPKDTCIEEKRYIAALVKYGVLKQNIS